MKLEASGLFMPSPAARLDEGSDHHTDNRTIIALLCPLPVVGMLNTEKANVQRRAAIEYQLSQGFTEHRSELEPVS